MSSGLKSGRARRKSSRFCFLSCYCDPPGLRSQTPMNHTASKPNAAIASHSAEWYTRQVNVLPLLLAQFRNPNPGVDLVQRGISGPDGHTLKHSSGFSKSCIHRISSWSETRKWKPRLPRDSIPRPTLVGEHDRISILLVQLGTGARTSSLEPSLHLFSPGVGRELSFLPVLRYSVK